MDIKLGDQGNGKPRYGGFMTAKAFLLATVIYCHDIHAFATLLKKKLAAPAGSWQVELSNSGHKAPAESLRKVRRLWQQMAETLEKFASTKKWIGVSPDITTNPNLIVEKGAKLGTFESWSYQGLGVPEYFHNADSTSCPHFIKRFGADKLWIAKQQYGGLQLATNALLRSGLIAQDCKHITEVKQGSAPVAGAAFMVKVA
ncbi:hypothetical protein OF83DRAFT_1173632 [Amylostereum chailletii]|nr:hypothetical protein OF83DRAFT_1173632 [Amylostereum chailletii]